MFSLSYSKVHRPARLESFVAQCLEHPIGVEKVIGSIPVGHSHFFFVPCSLHVNHITYHRVFITIGRLSLLVLAENENRELWYRRRLRQQKRHF